MEKLISKALLWYWLRRQANRVEYPNSKSEVNEFWNGQHLCRKEKEGQRLIGCRNYHKAEEDVAKFNTLLPKLASI